MPARTLALLIAAVILAAGLTVLAFGYLHALIGLPLGLMSVAALVVALLIRRRA